MLPVRQSWWDRQQYRDDAQWRPAESAWPLKAELPTQAGSALAPPGYGAAILHCLQVPPRAGPVGRYSRIFRSGEHRMEGRLPRRPAQWKGQAPASGYPPAQSPLPNPRSEEHTSELQSLMRISYAVFCLQKITQYQHHTKT